MLTIKNNTGLSTPDKWTVILKVSVAISLLGQAYAHFQGATAYRAILYTQQLSEWWVSLLGLTWQDYINNPVMDSRLDMVIMVTGGFLFITAVISLFITRRSPRWLMLFPIVASLLLCLQAYSHYLDAGLQAAQLFEYSLQSLSPLLLAGIWLKIPSRGFIFMGLILIALTFAAHGLYALGYYPVPGHFVDMTMASLNLSDDLARTLLTVAGIADIMVALALFINPVRPLALGYCIVWGLFTTAARYTTYVIGGALFWLTLDQTLPLILVRVVHFGIPLVWYLLNKKGVG
ncbi:hypothetical protein AB9P05_18055 [Roseivirga sp. BDSF3-8]|uniref:hypothetical protein n=1 Tax=Roseivirga sp. BDSF3-8 TaxID=3241598 RepID=UPI00353238A5